MKFIFRIPIDQIAPAGEFQNAEAVHELAQALERSGVEAAALTDHPAPLSQWLHDDPAGHDAIDPFTGLAFVAAATTRLKIITCVIVLPYRSPFVLAKAAATLQAFSGGRLILGVGAGYQKAEFDALGVPFSERGAISNEALETITLAWAGGPVIKQTRTFNAVGNEPRPVPSPPPPVWVGGGADKAVERAARWGDGWMPFTALPTDDLNLTASAINSMGEMKQKIGRIKELRDQLGRTGNFTIAPTPFYYPKANTHSEAQRFCEDIHELAAIGATWINTGVAAPNRSAFLDNLAWFREEIIELLQHLITTAAFYANSGTILLDYYADNTRRSRHEKKGLEDGSSATVA